MAISNGERPGWEHDDKVPEALRKLVAAMWSQAPSSRPSAHAVLAALQEDALVKELVYIAFKQSGAERGLAG